MTVFRYSRIAAIALAAPLATSEMAGAQTPYIQSPYAQAPYVQQSLTPDADALADQMRALAANPSDVNAMVRAGELTLKLDDPTAAAGFFARAERIDPGNPRIKAGKGTLLVMAGRPGEALQRFAEAELLRGDVRQFAADRGLAYDLIGEQERAQRDYRLALREGPANETLRRYALSLGISGRRDEALSTIDALLRRSDRGAWRARAFILAMNGDAPGAERIAASMMPGGLGQGLQPFFDRLPRLGAADRAFAVHFGEVRTTPQRLADARLIPRLQPLAPEPGRIAPVQVAAVTQPVRDDRQSRRDRRKRGRDRIDVVTVAPPVPLPQPPAYQPPAVATNYAQVYAPTTVAPSVPVTVAPVVLASNRALPSTVPGGRSDIAPIVRSTSSATTTLSTNEAAIRSVPPTPRAAEVATARPVIVEAKPLAAPVQLASATLPATAAAAAPATTIAVAPVPVVAVSPGTVLPSVAAVPTATVLPPVPGPAKGGDSFLARIVANITVPGSELEAAVEPAAVAAVAADDAQASLIAEQKAADRIANAKALADAQAAAERRAATETMRGEPTIVRRRGETTQQFEARKSAAADVSPALVQRRGESARAFAARKLAATATADDTLVQRRGETAKAFAARKLAATVPADDTIVRRRGETAVAFEARKRAAAVPSGDETPALTRRRGESAAAFETRKRAATAVAEDGSPLVRRRGETARQFAARQAAVDDTPALVRKPGESARASAARKLASDKSGKAAPKTAEPARIWVQVSGGANEGDLDKAWDKVRKDAPVAMRGRTGWMTPWKATNRVLAGPFKSDAEARGFVNALGKEGVSSFSFTSEAGQKVTRLGGK